MGQGSTRDQEATGNMSEILTSEQADAYSLLETATETLTAAFDQFAEAARACEESDVPTPMLAAKAGEIQQTILRFMGVSA
jgi:hypothetical protein